jgi:hypothetical protein
LKSPASAGFFLARISWPEIEVAVAGKIWTTKNRADQPIRAVFVYSA